jgi:cbb3-type cytochrome oxidase subunit 3
MQSVSKSLAKKNENKDNLVVIPFDPKQYDLSTTQKYPTLAVVPLDDTWIPDRYFKLKKRYKPIFYSGMFFMAMIFVGLLVWYLKGLEKDRALHRTMRESSDPNIKILLSKYKEPSMIYVSLVCSLFLLILLVVTVLGFFGFRFLSQKKHNFDEASESLSFGFAFWTK